MNFSECLKIVLAHEGGYVYDVHDPGGETRWGISKRAYPNLKIKDLTLEDAYRIYEVDYWNKYHIGEMPACVRLMVFDCAVNQGASRSIKFAQECLGIEADGIVGPLTFKAFEGLKPVEFLTEYAKKRHAAYIKIPQWARFGPGWSRRLLEISMISAFKAASK